MSQELFKFNLESSFNEEDYLDQPVENTGHTDGSYLVHVQDGMYLHNLNSLVKLQGDKVETIVENLFNCGHKTLRELYQSLFGADFKLHMGATT